MEIERISDEQIKFTLDKTDLEERDIQINDLSYGSDKSQELFREIMEEAMHRCGFCTDGRVPLVVEAVPIANESLMIIVTKATNKEAIHERFDVLARTRGEGKFVEKPIFESKEVADEDVALSENRRIASYVFASLDDVSNAAAHILKAYQELAQSQSSLVKYQGKLYLLMEFMPGEAENKPHEFEFAMSDYGQRHSVSALSNAHLREHGEVMIAESAIEKLAVL